MKVLDLRCSHGHGFEGWFASEEDFGHQHDSGLVECPVCSDKAVSRLPSAPRLNLSGARAPRENAPAKSDAAERPTEAAAPAASGVPAPLQALWMHAVREVMKNTEDVGHRFPEEARRIHYGEAKSRGIRGQATPQERAELIEEGIEVMPLVVPDALKGPAH
jgi:hypothetical protein